MFDIKVGEILHTRDGLFYVRKRGDTEDELEMCSMDGLSVYEEIEFIDRFHILKRELSVGGLWLQGTRPTEGMLIKNLYSNTVLTITEAYIANGAGMFTKVSLLDGTPIGTYGRHGSLLRCVPYIISKHNDIK